MFDDENLSAEEQRRLAEELGMSVDQLNLTPRQEDRALLTPDHRQKSPLISISEVGGASQVA